MFDLDKWNEIYLTVKQNKLRTFLTAFGVSWGIFMLVLLLAAGKGFQNGVLNSFDIAKNSLFVWSQRTSEPYMGLKVGRFIQLNTDDAAAIRHEIPETDAIVPQMFLDGNFTVNRGTKNSSFNVFGSSPDYTKVEPLKMKEGRFVNELDWREKRKVAVIGETVQKMLFDENESPIGEYIKIKGVFFRVVGVFKIKGKGEDAAENGKKIMIPLPTLQQSFNKANKVGWFAFTPKKGIPTDVVEAKIKTLLAVRHKISPTDLKAIGSANVEKEFKQIQGLFTGIRVFSWFVSICTIVAGIVGVGNIMLIVVRERTKEIGIRKALGATPFSIVSLIIQESVVITGIAGYMGLVFGAGLVELISVLMKKYELEGQFFMNPEVDVEVAVTATMLLVFTGALAGMLPAIKAANINPVEALADK
ncbi:MAG: ABC transporter permease [Bacteroidetes bacterium]|nr:MAG: ABC transporter permease [Bacteroidota bacterium]